MKKILFILSLTVSSFAYAAEEVPPPRPVEPSAPQVIQPAITAPAPVSQPKPILQPSSGQGSTPTAAAPVAPASQISDEHSIPSSYRPNSPAFNARLGAGLGFSPTAFWLTVDPELQFDKFIALGPKFQWGANSDTDFIFGSFGPRFIIPMNYFEVGFQAGLGFSYRNIAGFQFTNFLYEAAINFDIYLTKNVSLGLAYTSNITSSPAEKYIGALTFAVAGHF